MARVLRSVDKVKEILVDRSFSQPQIAKILPHLSSEYFQQPRYLIEILDTWQRLLSGKPITNFGEDQEDRRKTLAVVCPPSKSLAAECRVNLNTILADVEPGLLLLDPERLASRHSKIQGLGLVNSMAEHWTLLMHAPAGFYLQNWTDLMKKIYYIEQHIIDFLYDKKEQKEMLTHPLVKAAASVELEFDQLRTRYLFASRSGWRSLAQFDRVQTALDKPTLKDIILVDNEQFLAKFAPNCTLEEYSCFANLIKNHDIDEDDAEVMEKMAELDSLRH